MNQLSALFHEKVDPANTQSSSYRQALLHSLLLKPVVFVIGDKACGQITRGKFIDAGKKF